MKNFPSSLNVKFRDKFDKYIYERMKCYLRRELYEHILKEDEKSYFCLDKFNELHLGDIDKVKKMVNELIPELNELGWKCKLSYNDTGLFIYSTPDPPANCW